MSALGWEMIIMVTRVLDERDRKPLELLREFGFEEAAERYEASLRGERTIKAKPDPLPDPVPGAVYVAEAAERLGLTHRNVRRHVDLGLLTAESDPETGESLVTNTSIVRWLDGQRRHAIIAQPLHRWARTTRRGPSLRSGCSTDGVTPSSLNILSAEKYCSRTDAKPKTLV